MCIRDSAHGDYNEWVLRGANDGVAFADSGEDLKQINDWQWLKYKFNSIYELS